MYLRKHDLLQMDDEWLKKLPAELLLEVSKRLLHDVKELQDRLNQNPSNSSRPPTSEAPWERSSEPVMGEDALAERDTTGVAEASVAPAKTANSADSTEETAPATEGLARSSARQASGKRAGRQPGSQGFGRTQKLTVTATCEHRPETCTACGLALAAEAPSQACLLYTSRCV